MRERDQETNQREWIAWAIFSTRACLSQFAGLPNSGGAEEAGEIPLFGPLNANVGIAGSWVLRSRPYKPLIAGPVVVSLTCLMITLLTNDCIRTGSSCAVVECSNKEQVASLTL